VYLTSSIIATLDCHPQHNYELLKSFLLNLQGVPRIASSSTMCNVLLHFSRYSSALNLIFTAYTFSSIFPTFLSSLSQMEPMPCQVRNHYSQKNQEAHLERALAFKKGANLRCPSNVCLPSCIVLLMNNVPDFILEAG